MKACLAIELSRELNHSVDALFSSVGQTNGGYGAGGGARGVATAVAAVGCFFDGGGAAGLDKCHGGTGTFVVRSSVVAPSPSSVVRSIIQDVMPFGKLGVSFFCFFSGGGHCSHSDSVESITLMKYAAHSDSVGVRGDAGH